MKAAQITRYSKNIRMTVNDIPVPATAGDFQVVGGSDLPAAKKNNLFYDEE